MQEALPLGSHLCRVQFPENRSTGDEHCVKLSLAHLCGMVDNIQDLWNCFKLVIFLFVA